MLVAASIGGLLALRSPGPSGPGADTAAAIRADRESQIIVAQDQAPKARSYARGATPRRSLEDAVAGDVRTRIRSQDVGGPLQRVHCTATRAAKALPAFRCNARAGGVDYPFVGVVDRRSRTLTWCKRDPAPTSQLNVPVSPRCRA